ncbi:MAG: hypothetical protein RQ735_11635 [Flavobacteriaceae bacterium]|nr:hypothetical protein [Flavobacteriaceae bacterium]
MESEISNWSKEELKIYILLLCAKADSDESPDEINLIKSKTTTGIFDKMYKEIRADDETTSLEKIEAAIALHHYDITEVFELRKEMRAVFSTDKHFDRKERFLDEILDHIIY